MKTNISGTGIQDCVLELEGQSIPCTVWFDYEGVVEYTEECVESLEVTKILVERVETHDGSMYAISKNVQEAAHKALDMGDIEATLHEKWCDSTPGSIG